MAEDKKEKETAKQEAYAKTIYVYDDNGDKKEFPDEGLSIDETRDLLASAFPAIANAKKEETIKDGVRYITFVKKAGTLGNENKANS